MSYTKYSYEKHRIGIPDHEWENAQPLEQNYFIGDVVEFHVGGCGLIDEVLKSDHGGCPKYSTREVPGHDHHPTRTAWHYEGDFKTLLSPSGVRMFL